MFNRNNLKAATFVGAMLLTEYCFSSSGERAPAQPHHHDHHKRRHHQDENNLYMAGLVARILGLTAALALTSSARFALSRYSNNNSIAMGAGEVVLSYATGGGNALLAVGRGLFGSAVAQSINQVADPDNKPSVGLRK